MSCSYVSQIALNTNHISKLRSQKTKVQVADISGFVTYLGLLILGGCDEVGAVCGPLKVGDLHIGLVCLNIVELLSRLKDIPSALPSYQKSRKILTLASYCETVPSWCPAIMYFDK